jgi:hypothetical protein
VKGEWRDNKLGAGRQTTRQTTQEKEQTADRDGGREKISQTEGDERQLVEAGSNQEQTEAHTHTHTPPTGNLQTYRNTHTPHLTQYVYIKSC